ncbi:hypothetical protein D9758_008598 [Tetrapyrgos nigripes]|uniref:BTB domain-containing protein n=1 Tax=Tetrapyrgos nigripes TaxID=182062 RepID=A0A8H5LIX4_9AGAR|nr:hypothetical protein D9758_008598 [Tetrapyrgos nigripes]
MKSDRVHKHASAASLSPDHHLIAVSENQSPRSRSSGAAGPDLENLHLCKSAKMSASARASQTGPTNTKDSKPVVSRKLAIKTQRKFPSFLFLPVVVFVPVGPETGGDVVFLSSDNVLFHVHQKHLEAYAEGFPLGQHTIPSQNEIIPLSEKSSTLEIVFQFMLPQSPPELDGLEFEQLMELANASEKYVVYFARRDCALYMK